MRAELFSLRRTPEEVMEIEMQAGLIYQKLDKETDSHIVYKTLVDRNPKRIADALTMSLETDDLMDIYIFANAVDTTDSTSFRECFTPLAAKLEEAIDCSKQVKIDNKIFERHINVYSFTCKGTDIKGYCFNAIDKKFVFLPAFETVKDVSLPDFIADSVKTAEKLLKTKKAKHPDGTILLDKSEIIYPPKEQNGKVKNFFRSFIPVKGDSTKEVVLKIVVLIAIAVFIAGAVMLTKFYIIDPMKNDATISEIQAVFYSTPDETEEVVVATNDEGKVVETIVKKPSRNWSGLKKINKEIVAWVKLNGTKIDYPVLEHKGDDGDSQFYLYRNYKKEYSDFGSIFVDYRCLDSVKSKNFILHGHNMGSDDSMFGQLVKYARNGGSTQGNPEFYRKAPIVKIDTPEGSDDYIIFAVMKIDVSNKLKHVFNYLKADFESDAEFMNFVYNIKARSYLDVEVPVNEKDNLITLSTCSYETDNMRTVVVGRKLRENEKYKPYLKTAEPQNPVTMTSSTFSQELKDGNITWYDGKGNLKGDEDIEYLEQSEMYTVKFLDGNGKVISAQIVIKGKDAKPPKEDPRKTYEYPYYFVFKGWDKSYKNITKNTVIKPVFEKKLMDTQPPTTTTAPPETEAPYIPPEPEPPAPVVTEPKETAPPKTEAPPKETKPKETKPKETKPKETKPKATTPKETKPKATTPKPTKPKTTVPKATTPRTTQAPTQNSTIS